MVRFVVAPTAEEAAVKVICAGLDGVAWRVDGEKVTPLGSPVMARVTVELKPLIAVTDTVVVAVAPAVRLTLAGESEMEKSGDDWPPPPLLVPVPVPEPPLPQPVTAADARLMIRQNKNFTIDENGTSSPVALPIQHPSKSNRSPRRPRVRRGRQVAADSTISVVGTGAKKDFELLERKERPLAAIVGCRQRVPNQGRVEAHSEAIVVTRWLSLLHFLEAG